MRRTLDAQWRRNGAAMAAVYGAALLAVVGVGMVGNRIPGGVGMLMRDTTQTLEAPFYVGLVSNLGMILWCGAAAVCFFAAAALKRSGDAGGWSGFFRFGGAVTAMLLVDDFFLVHDEIVPKYLFPKKSVLHLNEKVVMAVYAAVAIRFVWKHRDRILRRTDWGLLALAVGLLGLSVVSERSFTKAFIPTKELRTLTEDGLKLLGIAGWALYFFRTALESVGEAARPPREPQPAETDAAS